MIVREYRQYTVTVVTTYEIPDGTPDEEAAQIIHTDRPDVKVISCSPPTEDEWTGACDSRSVYHVNPDGTDADEEFYYWS